MRIALIHHPQAVASRAARVTALVRVLEQCGHAVSLHDSGGFRFAEHAPDADLICLCGGDGTARLVLASQTDLAALPPLAIFPIGTINLLARELGYPADPLRFARRIEASGELRTVSLARMNGALFLCCASLGADARAVAALSTQLKARIGRLAYGVAFASLLWHWPRQVLEVTADGRQLHAEALFVLRGKHYAGPGTLDRRAALGSAALHVLALPRARRRDFFTLALYMLGGARKPRPEWVFLEVSQLDVTALQPSPVQFDGDLAGSTPLAFRVTRETVRWK